MKDYREMADSVFEKIERREKEEREKRRKMMKITSLAASFAVVVAVGVGVKINLDGSSGRIALNEEHSEDEMLMKGEVVGSSEREMEEGGMIALPGEAREETAKIEMAEEESILGEKKEGRRLLADGEEAKKEEQIESDGRQRRRSVEKQVENRVIMNTGGDWINQCNIPELKIALKQEDMRSCDKEEIKEHFHTNIFPEVPKDLEAWDNGDFSVYKRDKGKGETYYDRQVLSFSSKDFKRNLRVEVESVKTGTSCGAAPKEGKFEASMINGREVFFFNHKEGIYSAEFKIGETNFILVAEGLKEEEVVQVVESFFL